MKKLFSGLLVVALFSALNVHADDGEGLSTPSKGTCERLAYDAATAQYMKDDGNNAYHLAGIKLVDGGTTFASMIVEIDFYSAEDGEYSYEVELKALNPASEKTKCEVSKVKSLQTNS